MRIIIFRENLDDDPQPQKKLKTEANSAVNQDLEQKNSKRIIHENGCYIS